MRLEMNVLLLGTLRDIGYHTIEALYRAGHEVQFAENVREALAKVQQEDFDCFVLSYSLSSETLKELTEVLRQHRPACPTIVISERGTIDWELARSVTLHPERGVEALLDALADLERCRPLNLRSLR